MKVTTIKHYQEGSIKDGLFRRPWIAKTDISGTLPATISASLLGNFNWRTKSWTELKGNARLWKNLVKCLKGCMQGIMLLLWTCEHRIFFGQLIVGVHFFFSAHWSLCVRGCEFLVSRLVFFIFMSGAFQVVSDAIKISDDSETLLVYRTRNTCQNRLEKLLFTVSSCSSVALK